MKLKNIIFILFLAVLILFIGNTYVLGTDISSDLVTIKNDVNQGVDYWNKNIYAFCLDHGYKSPHEFKERRLFTIDNFNIYKSPLADFKNEESNGFLKFNNDDEIIKTAYIYSSINYDSRSANFFVPQQYALWQLMGLTYLKVLSEETGDNPANYWEWIANENSPFKVDELQNTQESQDKQNKFQQEIDIILANSEAYWDYYKSKANHEEDKIDTSEVKLENNKLGPFYVYYKSSNIIKKNSQTHYTYEDRGINSEGKRLVIPGTTTGEPVECQYPNILEVTLKKPGEETGLTMKDGTVASQNSYTCDESFSYNKNTGQMKYTFCLDVQNISDITQYSEIEIKLNGEIKGQLLIGESEKRTQSGDKYYYQQTSILGDIEKTEKIISASFAGIDFELLKKDSETGTQLDGAVFGYAGYIYNQETKSLELINPTYIINGNKSEVEDLGLGQGWRKISANDKINITNISNYDDFYIVLKEVSAPVGYTKLDYYIALRFHKENGEWTCKEIEEAIWGSNGFEFKERNENNSASFDNDTLKLTVENQKNDFGFGIKKIDSKKGVPLSGASFKVSIKDSSNNEIKSETKTTDSNGDAYVSVELGNSNETTYYAFIEETSAPSGYTGYGGKIELKFEKQTDGSWNGTMITPKSSKVSWSSNILTVENDPKDPTGDDPTGDNPTPPDPSKDIIEGYVYLDGYSGNKIVGEPDREKGSDQGVKGVIVRLSDGRWTTTKEDGSYEFNNITRGDTYTITFEYDGVNYQATKAGPGSQATETTRDSFNKKFETINYGQTKTGIGLTYWPYGDDSNWNPKYNERPGWLLKTLDQNQVVINNDFKMTASTEFKLENRYQKWYETDESIYAGSHQHGAGCYSSCNDPKCKSCPHLNCSSSHCSCYWPDAYNDGDFWLDDVDSITSDSAPHPGGREKYRDTGKRSYFISGGTPHVNSIDETESLTKKTGTGQNIKYYNTATPSDADVTEESECKESVTYNLNFGLVKREVDLSLVNDLFRVDVSINGKSTQYDYADVPLRDDRNVPLNAAGTDMSDEGYDYLLELTQNDFLYGTSIYPEGNSYVKNPDDNYIKNSGYSEDRPLTIISTYRVALNNQSTTDATVNSIAYYYDSNYMEPSQVYIGDYNGNQKGTCTKTNNGTQVIDGITYNRIDITGIPKVTGGGQQYVYIAFEMDKNNTVDNTVERKTYNTIAEITSYSADEGKVDIDSAPGNAVENNSLVYEDDTDKAPGLEVRENNSVRVLRGNVWDDSQKDENGKYTFADGIKEDGDDGVSGVIAQLIEVKEVGGERQFYLWDQTRTDYYGDYEFTNFIPGNYIVRFIYGYDGSGDTYIYNGQDYKSTKDNNYDEYKDGAWYNEYHEESTGKSVARDDEARRLNTIANTSQIDKGLATALEYKTNLDITWMYADTSKINIAVAFRDKDQAKETDNETTVDGTKESYYSFESVNLGLEERPKTEIILEKHITGLRITANDGTTIVDAEGFIENGSVKFTENSIRKGLTAMGATRNESGYWRLETDIEEVIQGATLELVYTYTVRNVGEEDYISTSLAESFENVENMDEYKDKLNTAASHIRGIITEDGYNSNLGKYLGTTYYTGTVGTDVSIVKTRAGKIEDYINNDLKFKEVESSDFKIDSDASNKKYSVYKPNKNSGTYEETEEKINQVVLSKYVVGTMAPGEVRTQKITLESNGKLTSTGTLDFPAYMAQLKSAYSNSVGRRDVFSIPDNLQYVYDVEILGNEKDEYWAETVEITKPTGADKQLAIILSISITAGIAIIAAGAFAIKKYVL